MLSISKTPLKYGMVVMYKKICPHPNYDVNYECPFRTIILDYFWTGWIKKKIWKIKNLTHWALDHIKMWSDTIILDSVFKKFWIMYQKKKKNFLQKMNPHLSQLNVAMAHIFHFILFHYFRRNHLQILKLAIYTKIEDHYSRCKLATF